MLAGVLPATVLLIGMSFLGDTPRWLLSKKRDEEAKAIFNKIEPDSDADAEIANIKETLKEELDAKDKKIKFKKWMIMPLVVGIGIMFAQICTGINTIIYYAPTIFKISGFDSNISAIYAATGIGVVNFLMTIVAIAFTDKLGRQAVIVFWINRSDAQFDCTWLCVPICRCTG